MTNLDKNSFGVLNKKFFLFSEASGAGFSQYKLAMVVSKLVAISSMTGLPPWQVSLSDRMSTSILVFSASLCILMAAPHLSFDRLSLIPCIFPTSICILMTDNSLSRPNLVLYLSFMYDTNLNRKPPQKKGLISLTKKPF